MKTTLEDLLAGLPAQEGNGGQPLGTDVSASKSKASTSVTQLDRTTANVRRVLDDEALLRTEKTAKLKAAREKRDAGRKG
ncbi:hypothetical protein V8J36_09255 [Frigidibacter sp. MR17.14]|uniref:hypothetical protein n=1 Tax=Frigidibacter sp. MR17.14 TaxID=3126509 RepID=UPI003012DF8F